jgi:hypothetical protein
VKAWILARPFALASLAIFIPFSQAQQSLQVLHRHVRPAVSSGQAALAGSLPQTQRLNLAIVLPLRNQSALTSLLSRLYNPSSPDYRHFLSVDQFTQQFGPTAEDYQAVVEFARANGFTVTSTPANRMIVPISGSAAQVEKAFNVRMNIYQHPTEKRTFYSPDREPSLALSVAVAHISGLDNFSIPRPMVTKASAGQVTANPAVLGSGPGGAYLASDMRAAYYTSTLPNGSTALTGSGQTVGLVEFDGYNISDVTSSFDGTATSSTSGTNYVLSYTPTAGGTTYSIPVNNVLLDGATGASISDNDAEETLDIVQAIGMAPGLSQVRVYIGDSDVDVLNEMATENLAKQIGISWTWTPVDPSTDDFIFQELAAQGQSVFAASGDDGEFDPLVDNFYPAEDAWVTTVGGTDLITSSAGGQWSSETAWTYSGGGISPDGIPIPSWQTGVANSANGGSTTLRNVPDVAAQADTVNYDCNMGTCQEDWGGTSFAAPRWAGFMAMVNQQAVAAGNPTLGFVNPAIYAIGEGPSYDIDFHDITSGNNSTEGGCCGQTFFYAVPGYDLVTGWGSPTGQELIDALAPPASEGFKLSASLSSLTIAPGAFGTSNISVIDVDGFTGSVNLSASGLPSGVTASFGTNPASGASLLTLTVGSSAIRGSYLVTITGVSGTVTATTTLALEVNAPGFSLTPMFNTMLMNAGESGSNTIEVTDYAGFTGSVSLAVTSGLPSGVTASWSTNPTTGASALTLTADNSAASNTRSMVTITGTSGTLSATTTIALTVDSPLFSLNVSPTPFTLVQNSSVTANVTVAPWGSFSGPVTLAAPKLPYGVTATFNPNPATGSSVVTMTTSSSASLGSSITEFSGTGASSTAFFIFQQTVIATAAPTFTLGVSPAAVTLTRGSSVTDTVTVTPQNGFTGNVSLEVTFGLPSGVTASWSKNPTNGTSVLTLTASSTAQVGSGFLVNISGSAGYTVPVLLFLTVNPAPGFSLAAQTASLNVSPGSSVTDYITMGPQTGFSGNVTLSAPNLPNGLTASFNPNPITGTSLLTLTASDSFPSGNYLVTVTGTSGIQTVTVPIALGVGVLIPTTTVLTINPSGNTLTTGESYSLTAKVSPESGSAVPTGNVIFTIGSATQSADLNSSGIATYNGTAPGTAGGLTLSAAYQGTSTFSASTSNTLSETIMSNVTPSFTVAGTSVTVEPGATTGNTSTITVAPSGGFTGNVALTATITSSPAGAQYPPTFSFGLTTPVSINGSNSGTATLTVNTTSATSASLVKPMHRGFPWYTEGGAALACILLIGIPAPRRRWRTMLGMLALLVTLAGGVLACGGGGGLGSGGDINLGTTAGTYTITVTGTSGTTTATGPVTLIVQ